MKELKREQIETMIEAADNGELDVLVGAIVNLSSDGLAELKALAWLGKDDESPKHWDALIIEARFQNDDQTARYIADIPELGARLRRGLSKLEDSGRI